MEEDGQLLIVDCVVVWETYGFSLFLLSVAVLSLWYCYRRIASGVARKRLRG